MKNNLIGISGKIGSGKDTIGEILQYLSCNKGIDVCTFEDWKTYNSGQSSSFYQIKKYADKLKDIVCLLIGCTREQLEDREFKEKELGEEWKIPLIEKWKDIPGYEGLYLVSTFGRIKTLERRASNGKLIVERIKDYHIGTTGYPSTTLSKDGKKKTKMVHQLVAIAFLEHVPNKYESVVNHIDENKLNNRLDNIEVVSSRYNTQYSKSTDGVYFRNNKYEVYIRIRGKKTYLGAYSSKEDALEVRTAKLKEIDTFISLRYTPKQWTPRLLLQSIGTQVGRDIIHPNIWVNSLFTDFKNEDSISFNLKSVEPEKYYGHSTIVDMNSIKDISSKWIITDVRFPNEAQAIKDRGGIVIRVNRLNRDDVVYWEDPEGFSSGVYKIRSIDTEEVKITQQDSMSEHQVLLRELSLFKDPEHFSETALDDYEFDHVIENRGSIEELVEKVKQLDL